MGVGGGVSLGYGKLSRKRGWGLVCRIDFPGEKKCKSEGVAPYPVICNTFVT